MNYNEIRRKTREIRIGNIAIGGNNPIRVQSMLNTDPTDFDSSYKQVSELKEVGCDIIRMAITGNESLKVLDKLKNKFPDIPFVSDIQFDYKLAIKSVDYGADKVRVNPGNIGNTDKVKKVIEKCNSKNIPIRIGINSGSLEKNILNKYGAPTAEALAESALNNVKLMEDLGFYNLVISIKSSSPYTTYKANKIFSDNCDYPVHLGVTEAGFGEMALLKSNSALSTLLMNGIGDTIRISLTESPKNEVIAAEKILKSLGLSNNNNYNLISCPTCGRTKIDLFKIVNQVDEKLKLLKLNKNITVAIMGCVVNGPGEASEADIGLAGGDKCAVIFSHGKILRKISEENIIDELMTEIIKINNEV